MTHLPVLADSEAASHRTLIARSLQLVWRVTRGMTLGVRGMVLDGEGRVFLVRHSYVPGWHMPGGGVEAGETFRHSLTRELAEEGNITLTAEPVLHGIFLNEAMARRDHVAVYVCRDFVQTAPRRPDREIVESGFYPVTALPEGTTRGTRARLAEVLQGATPSLVW
jgi:ADP-ribose pyrophosphatase YjhB (NUDIX family)